MLSKRCYRVWPGLGRRGFPIWTTGRTPGSLSNVETMHSCVQVSYSMDLNYVCVYIYIYIYIYVQLPSVRGP